MNLESIINKLSLEPLENEGGMYRETYRSKNERDGVPESTAILYLLTQNSFSHLHKLSSDEIWHFYAGNPVELIEITPKGEIRKIILGNKILENQNPQVIIEGGNWMGARLLNNQKESYCLLGTTMAPGYTSDSYIHANSLELINEFPHLKNDIIKFTGDLVYK